ncbi:hypothetical protein EG831_09055 [bacterium]|nr:hypothetical protein [bacterium]
MSFLEIAALALGAMLIWSGVRAIRRQATRAEGEDYEGASAVRLGWLWVALGAAFVIGVVADVGFLKAFFKLFLEAAN